mgnify:CR=1 FL=1
MVLADPKFNVLIPNSRSGFTARKHKQNFWSRRFPKTRPWIECGNRSKSLFNYWVIWLPPVSSGVIHHDIDKHRQQTAENSCAVADLVSVDAAVPSCTAMDHLVAKDIEPVKDRCQDAWGVSVAQRRRDGPLAFGEAVLPIVITRLAIEVVPERREHIAVVEQQSDLLGEARPDGVVDAMPLVEFDQCIEVGFEGTALAAAVSFDVGSICGIEADPQQDEADIDIIGFGFGSAQPADGAMDTQAHRIRKILAKCALLCFEQIEVQRRKHCSCILCHKYVPASRQACSLPPHTKVNPLLIWEKLLASPDNWGQFRLMKIPIFSPAA